MADTDSSVNYPIPSLGSFSHYAVSPMEIDDGSPAGQGRLRRLRCSVHNYDWGRIGRDSGVARLFSLNAGAEIEEEKPYAELWMGTHGSGPSFVVQSGENGVSVGEEGGDLSLKSWIAQNPSVLGDKVVDKWGSNLPFLFKVLSVAKALSIQAHPDKKLAEVLHKAQPNNFKDDNHKPEMALALTEFEALCGFIDIEELKCVIQNVPEIVEVVGNECANQVLHVNKQDGEEKLKAVLQSIFTQLMSASKDVISKVVPKLIGRLNMENKVRQLTDKEQLVLQLERQYPADIGVIVAFLFNYVKLKPGEALWLGANELHAYIRGECIECMATSDNVVRAGLTPKNRDVQILCSMLTYKQGPPEILQGIPLNPYTRRYLPPFEEFEVDRCVLSKGTSTVFPAIPGPSIFIVVEGEGTMCTSSEDIVTEGDVLFAAANTEISVTTSSELHLYRAGVNSRFF
ncbi:mannose-6-phosphate isomerase 1-like [Cornus florida]|uniref:mannose-6-phosphate isomerase 1-like n=1 Tax=Cornus florida TaxID=4283 RepID=UPI00289DFD27|nr:mannose-6-phosphate isomerase 1-like [Cornus florida]